MHRLKQQFHITHPFHPQSGKQFDLVSYRRAQGRPVVEFEDEGGLVQSVPLAWTDASPPDPFVVLAAGRAHFRVEDLVRLVDLLGRLEE